MNSRAAPTIGPDTELRCGCGTLERLGAGPNHPEEALLRV